MDRRQFHHFCVCVFSINVLVLFQAPIQDRTLHLVVTSLQSPPICENSSVFFFNSMTLALSKSADQLLYRMSLNLGFYIFYDIIPIILRSYNVGKNTTDVLYPEFIISVMYLITDDVNFGYLINMVTAFFTANLLFFPQ